MARGQRLAARFEGLLSKLGTSFGEGQLDATLHRDGGRTGPSYNPTILPATDHACIVLWGEFAAEERAGGLVEDGDSRLEVGATTLDVEPQAGDKVTVGRDDVPGQGRRSDTTGGRADTVQAEGDIVTAQIRRSGFTIVRQYDRGRS